MDTVLVECWNCGLKLRVNIDKLAAARCGNCQQMIAKEGQPEAEAGFANQPPDSKHNEARPIGIKQTEQRQEEKKILATSEPRAENSNSSLSATSARDITSKELLLALGICLIIALILQAVVAGMLVYSAPDEQEKRELFVLFFNFSDPGTLRDLIRSFLTLGLFLFLSLKKKLTRLKRYIIVTLVGAVAFAIQDGVYSPSETRTPFDHAVDNSGVYLMEAIFILGGIVAVDFLTRWLFRLDAHDSTRRNNLNSQPYKKGQTENRSVVKEKRKMGQVGNFIQRIFSGAVGWVLGLVLGIGLLAFVFFLFYAATGMVGGTFSVAVAFFLFLKFGEPVINGIANLFDWIGKQWRESREDRDNQFKG